MGCFQSPVPGSGSNSVILPALPSQSLASSGGSFFTVMFGQDFAYGGGGLRAAGVVGGEGFEGGDVLRVEIDDERGDKVLFALLGALGGVDEAVGDARHCRDDHDDGALGGGRFDDRGGALDAVGVAYRGTAEFHDLEGEGHFRLGIYFRTREGACGGGKAVPVT